MDEITRETAFNDEAKATFIPKVFNFSKAVNVLWAKRISSVLSEATCPQAAFL